MKTVESTFFRKGLLPLFLCFLLSFSFTSCEVQSGQGLEGPESSKIMANVKTITTRFISHQNDTQVKDYQVIATANFNVDGSVDKVVQHMTYPYNYDEPFERNFWYEPEMEKVTIVMDGLELGKAEYNFLYGHDWPVKYAAIARENHPDLLKRAIETKGVDVNVSFASGGWPSEIVLEEYWTLGKTQETRRGTTYYENFSYEQDRITSYSKHLEMPLEFYPESMRKAIKNKKVKRPGGTKFFYEEDNLSRIEEGNKSYRFYYDDNDVLTRSEFYVRERMYNSRYYFYDENGLKTGSEIYNVDGEAEYTITYEYEFFEES